MKQFYIVLLVISFCSTSFADFCSFFKNGAAQKEVWLGAAIVASSWGLHKLFAPKFYTSSREVEEFKTVKSQESNSTTDAIVSLYLKQMKANNSSFCSFKDANDQDIPFAGSQINHESYKNVKTIEIGGEEKNGKRKVDIFVRKNNDWIFTETEQEKQPKQITIYDKEKEYKFRMARNLGMFTGLGILFWGMNKK
jgi:hypothetical protein